MNGTNVIPRGNDAMKNRNGGQSLWLWLKQVENQDRTSVYFTKKRLGPIPYNLHVYVSASSVNSAMSRDFVKFIVTDKRALALRERLQYVHAAEEFFSLL